jgi:predicted AlkP superfamily phosphohydrolase/phosphomutase
VFQNLRHPRSTRRARGFRRGRILRQPLPLLPGLAGLFVLGGLLVPIGGPARAETPSHPRVIVLGFDGADAHLTEQYMQEGVLPHLAHLRDIGTYAPLGTTTPPQTPVSWSSFATGKNPGKNGIFDFLRRDLKTYQPDFAMYDIGSRKVLLGKQNHLLVAAGLFVLSILLGLAAGALSRRLGTGLVAGTLAGLLLGGVALVAARGLVPYRRPTVVNTRQGDTFWELAGRHGLSATVVRVPATFPPRAFPHGEILAGLGVPDIRGTFGTFSFYTTEALPQTMDKNTEMGGKIIPVKLVNGEASSVLYGPRNRLFDDPPEILPPVHFRVEHPAGAPERVIIEACGQTHAVAVGEWSDWFTLVFPFNALVRAYGIARFYLVSAEPLGLYMSPVNLDPHRPVLPISAPPPLSDRLADHFGLYKTLGWSMDTWALNEQRIDEKAFLEDVYFTEGKFDELMRGLLDQKGFDLYVHVFELTDRVSHVFWRFQDPTHPAYDSTLAVTYGGAIRDAYVFMDRVVGEAMDRMDPEDVLLVCSDHGFHTWHKMANYNTWLVHHGYMTLKGGAGSEKTLEDLFGQGQFWPNVDWRRTKAYAMGLGDIYLNVKGRESQGIVEPGEEYERIRSRLIADLTAWIDPENGEHPVRRVLRREEVYKGFDPNVIPDLLVANNPGYRVSWQTSLGGIPEAELELNNRKWSGDHCSLDAEITKGILFSNRKLAAGAPTILDLFPTILNYLHVPIPEDLDGRVLPETR